MKNKSHEQKSISNFFFKNTTGNVKDTKDATPVKSTEKKSNKLEGYIENMKEASKETDVKKDLSTKMEEAKQPVMKTNILADFDAWLSESKAVWTSQKSRPKSNDLLGSKSKHFPSFKTSSKENMFKTSVIKILQIIEGLYGNLKLWVIFNNQMELITLNLKRKLYINSHTKDVSNVFVSTKMTLPRDKPNANLFEVELDEKDFTEKFNNFNDYMVDPNVEGVYESKIPLLFKSILDYGCQVRYKDNKTPIHNLNKHVFNYADFEQRTLFDDNYLSGNEFSIYYLYHSNLDSKHFFALFFFQKQEVQIFIVNKVKEIQFPDIKKIIQQSLEKEDYITENVKDFKFSLKKVIFILINSHLSTLILNTP